MARELGAIEDSSARDLGSLPSDLTAPDVWTSGTEDVSPGVLDYLYQDWVKPAAKDIARPAFRMVEGAGQAAELLGKSPSVLAGKMTAEEAQRQVQEGRATSQYPGFEPGEIKPLEGIGEGIGAGLQIGSNIPFAGGAKTVAGGALKLAGTRLGKIAGEGIAGVISAPVRAYLGEILKTGSLSALEGAIAGLMHGGGSTLSEGGTAGEAVVQGGIEGALGGITGGVLGTGAALTGTGTRWAKNKYLANFGSKVQKEALNTARIAEQTTKFRDLAPFSKTVKLADERWGHDPHAWLAKNELIPTSRKGATGQLVWDATDQRNFLNEEISSTAKAIKGALESTGESVSFNEWQQQATKELTDSLSGTQRDTALKRLQAEMASLKKQFAKKDATGKVIMSADGSPILDITALHERKQDFWNKASSIFKKATSENDTTAATLYFDMAKAAQGIIEQKTAGLPIHQWNKELGNMMNASERLLQLDGKPIPGGMSKYFTQTAGAIAGSSIFGPAGAAAGTITAAQLADFLRSPEFTLGAKKKAIEAMKAEGFGSIVQEANALREKLIEQAATRPLLPAGSIPLQAPKGKSGGGLVPSEVVQPTVTGTPPERMLPASTATTPRSMPARTEGSNQSSQLDPRRKAELQKQIDEAIKKVTESFWTQ